MSQSRQALILPGQPWDHELLQNYPLYRQSRKLFRLQKGRFESVLLSSPRSLGSVSLIENHIQYNPIEKEILWSLADKIQRKDEKHFEILRSFTTNVFHEQNHRNVWSFFFSEGYCCPPDKMAASRFLNFAESLVVALDFALGDQIGLRKGRDYYRLGVLYSPGSDYFSRFGYTKRMYRNYLHTVTHAVYLRLEGLHPEDIPPAIHHVFQSDPLSQREHALKRAFLLDNLFVELTNPTWQGRHLAQVRRGLGAQGGWVKKGKPHTKPLTLPYRKPLEYTLAYVLAEKWFEKYGL